MSRNGWRKAPSYSSLSEKDEYHEKLGDRLYACRSVLRAPRFKRMLAIAALLVACLVCGILVKLFGPWLIEEHAVWNSFVNNETCASITSGSGCTTASSLSSLTQLARLDHKHLPTPGAKSNKRLIFIGDIHGCKQELLALLEKSRYDPSTDHIIATGDIINKGPDTTGVIDFLREHGASSVRGNHEDQLLSMVDQAGPRPKTKSAMSTKKQPAKGKKATTLEALSQELTSIQIDYLRSFPIILDVGKLEGMGHLIVVHAGIMPGVALEAQDPAAVMNMRTIDVKSHISYPDHERKGRMPWSRLFNKYERILFAVEKLKGWKKPKRLPRNHTVIIYGHDARKGLQIARYTKGLDTACVAGGKLTAMIVGHKGQQSIVQVDCENHRRKKSS